MPRKLTCGNCFCKVTGSKIVVSNFKELGLHQRKKIEGEHYCKSQLLNLLKRKNQHRCFHKPATYWKWTPPLTISWKHRNKNVLMVNAKSTLFQR